VLDVGCGNGALAAEFSRSGYRVTGIDMASRGIEIARANCPEGRFEVLPADHQLLERLAEEPFDLVYSIEVIEHLYDPKNFLHGCYLATKPSGMFLCSTPYHGYLKNLAISLVNGWDSHANPQFDGGHIKFYSKRTFASAVANVGFTNLSIIGSGRLPYLWKSMMLKANRPGASDAEGKI
jgi:2-polyprenyl-3-methyl-5-hydroxy-6-metoxy-1,4-benzoquinol methylase